MGFANCNLTVLLCSSRSKITKRNTLGFLVCDESKKKSACAHKSRDLKSAAFSSLGENQRITVVKARDVVTAGRGCAHVCTLHTRAAWHCAPKRISGYISVTDSCKLRAVN